jgi:hypothetical protein
MKRSHEQCTSESTKRFKTSSSMPQYIRIVLNKCHGGFGLSREACMLLMSRLGHTSYEDRDVRNILDSIPRHHPDLVDVVQIMGKRAWVQYWGDNYIHKPVIVEIPNVAYAIHNRDGWEMAYPINFERNVLHMTPET